ncbi:MAG: hypothetical protein ACJAX4_000019 [Clostridium sp.]|jgi:hypothetical protein
MTNCTIHNKTNGKPAKLYAKLLEIFKTTKEADLYYSKLIGSDFKDKFGDWEKKYNAEPGEDVPKTGKTLDNGEPELFNIPGTTQYYFELLDETRFLVNKKGLRGSFSPIEIKEISKYFLFDFVEQGGIDSFNKIKTKKGESKLMKVIEKSIQSYKDQTIEKYPEGSLERRGLTRRINKVELFKEDFKNELIVNLDALGRKYLENIVDDEGNVVGEVAEEDKDGGLNIAESMTVNAKSTATINTKILLSQLLSRKLNEDTGKKEVVRSKFLGTIVFEDFSEVWEVLQPLLADKVSEERNEGITSTYSKMKTVVNSLVDDQPWAQDLLNKLDAMYNEEDGGIENVAEFVQAFNKTKLNYYVTEFDKENSSYTVYNATSTNSRESQILDRWGIRFQNLFLEDGKKARINKDGFREISKIKEESDAAFIELKDLLQLAGGDQKLINDAYNDAAKSLFKSIRKLGIFDLKTSDINKLILLNGGNDKQLSTVTKLFESIEYLIDGSILTSDGKGKPKNFNGDGLNGINPFRDQPSIKKLAQAVALRELDISESNILTSDGKMFFAYSNPTYVSNKINEWKEDPSKLEELALLPINANSRWIKYLTASEITDNKDEKEALSTKRLDALQYGLANSFTSKGKNDGVDNKSITLNDQINDNLSKMLKGKFKGGKSMFPTIIAADKARRIELSGFEFVDSRINNRGKDGKAIIPQRTVDIFIDYFSDEYNRMIQVARDMDNLPNDQKVEHYHLGAENGLKSQLFPGLNPGTVSATVGNLLYDKKGKPLLYKNTEGLSQTQRDGISEIVRQSLLDRLQETKSKLDEMLANSKVERKLIDKYSTQGGTYAMAGDYLVNGLVASIEYTKMFTGDPAYFKNNADFMKRVPATYSDGLQLALESRDDMRFNLAVVQNVEVASQYVDEIKRSLKDKSIAEAYEEVNTTDAQGWITPRRWRFLKKRLGQWTIKHDSAFKKMQTGQELENDELKLAAQPLKGVYFDINKGVPTYLKYSQAVLIPSMVQSTPMKRLLDKMQGPTSIDSKGRVKYEVSEADEVHEVVTSDGIKVGGIAPTKINDGESTQLADEFELNSNEMSNKGWKLQQDLPVKTMHETNIGTQIQKNILEGFDKTAEYQVFGEEDKITGALLLQKIHDSLSDLVNIGASEVKEKLGINANDQITDKDSLYRVIIAEFQERGGNENIITALEKRTPFDSIPQIRGRIDSILMSVFNRATTKIATEGGSFIQVSPFGFESIEKKYKAPIVEVVKRYSTKDLINNPEKIYVFGDNTDRKGTGGQAQIRPLENAFGIATKVHPTNNANAFMSDDNLEENKKVITSDIKKLISSNKELVFPEDGFGTGLADLKNKAPKTYEFLSKILMDSFGFNNENGSLSEVKVKESKKSSIKIVSERYNGKGLLPPRAGENGQTLPGQVMIPHTLAIKILRESGKDIDSMTSDDWLKLFRDPKVRELVGYRIPNQGMASNDTLEIVGILPASMGDSIIGYDGIPSKTGSDFDIDKMYIMGPNLMYNKKEGTFEILNDENKKFYKGKKNVNKLIAQNKVVSLYTDVLQSPLTYDNMMTSIDGGALQDDIAGNKKKGIKGLFPEAVYENLELFSPLTQLKTKMNYMSGTTGVGLTANQLVDNVANQTLNISIKADLGLGNRFKEDGKTVTFMDRKVEGKSITQVLSQYLNAYVDIAKDAYVTRGNHNGFTANVTFMLIRAGVPMKTVNRYIGQPILAELIELKNREKSITGNRLKITNKDGSESSATPYEFLREKYNIKENEKSRLKLDTLTNKDFEDRIEGKENLLLDSIVLNSFEFHESAATKWTDGVLAAKTDAKGAGGSPVAMKVAINKIQKVKDVGFIKNYESKFAGTSLGTFREQALYFPERVLENSKIVLSGTTGAKSAMTVVSQALSKEAYIVSEKLGKAVEKGMYSYMMSSSSMMKDNKDNFKYLFEELPNKIIELQETTDNFLLKELQIELRGGYNFIGINSNDKPQLYQNNIYRAWMNLYENEETKKLATDLVKYSYSQSGFNANLNQFFTHIPHEILNDEGLNFEMNSFYDKIDLIHQDGEFLDQFARHESGNIDVIKRISVGDMFKGSNNQLAFVAKPSFKEKFQSYRGGKAYTNYPDFISSSVALDSSGKSIYGLFKLEKMVMFEGYTVPLYKRTYKLGYTAGKNKVFEYSYEKKVKQSVVSQNRNEFNKTFSNNINKHAATLGEDLLGENSNDSSEDPTKVESSQLALNLDENTKQENKSIDTGEEQSVDEEANVVSLSDKVYKKYEITKNGCKD